MRCSSGNACCWACAIISFFCISDFVNPEFLQLFAVLLIDNSCPGNGIPADLHGGFITDMNFRIIFCLFLVIKMYIIFLSKIPYAKKRHMALGGNITVY